MFIDGTPAARSRWGFLFRTVVEFVYGKDEYVLREYGGNDEDGNWNNGKLYVQNAIRKKAKPFGVINVYCNGTVLTQSIGFERDCGTDEVNDVLDKILRLVHETPEENETEA